MKKLMTGMMLAGAIIILSSQSSYAGWGGWKPSKSTTPAPVTPAPTDPPSGGSTGDGGGGSGGGTPAVPEPGTMLLMGTGAAALAFARRRKNRKAQA